VQVGSSGPAGSVSGTAVELRLAGTFRVVRDGAQLTDGEIGSRKSRTLLKLLAVERASLVTVDRIVEILWPDERPASPEQNVAIMVSRLRAVLGAELIQGGRAGYRLVTGPGVVVDLDVAAGFCEQAEGKLSTAAAVALAAAERAHELLAAGTAIGEEHYADWADPARGQVRELLRRVRLAAAEAALATGDPRRAAGYAEAAVAADPLDEAAHRWYMSAAAAAGEQAKALAAYEALRQRLGRELGADPAPQTRELHVAILREQDGGLTRSRSARAAHPGPMPGAILLTQGADDARMVGDRRLEMLALYELGIDVPVQRGLPVSHHISNLENGLRIAESLGDRASEANMRNQLAVIAANRLRLDAALDHGLRGVAAGRAAADDHALASGLDGLKTVYLSLGDISALTGVLAELIPLLRRLRDPFLLQWAEFENAFPAIAAADWTLAAAAMQSAIEINRTAGYPHCAAWYVAHQGWLARLRGHMEEAIMLGHQAVELTEQHEATWWQATACAILGDTMLLAGDRAEAIALFERGLAAARQAGVEAYLLRCTAPLASATGSRAVLTEAAELLDQASIPDDGAWMLGYEAYLSLAEAWLAHGEPSRARATLTPLLTLADREPWIPALAAALAVDGRALARLGQREQARAAL
jgi:DNA-binding SARP family transcriptional activator/tetratricopeptide (TPR) repeat protein